MSPLRSRPNKGRSLCLRLRRGSNKPLAGSILWNYEGSRIGKPPLLPLTVQQSDWASMVYKPSPSIQCRDLSTATSHLNGHRPFSSVGSPNRDLGKQTYAGFYKTQRIERPTYRFIQSRCRVFLRRGNAFYRGTVADTMGLISAETWSSENQTRGKEPRRSKRLNEGATGMHLSPVCSCMLLRERPFAPIADAPP